MSRETLARTLPEDARIAAWRSTDGWPLRTFDWAPPRGAGSRGALLFLGGRGDFFEKYLDTLAHFRAAGWHVTWFDWRGQAGSGRTTPHAHVGDIADFALYAADLRAFWAAWKAQHVGPRVVIGHSMGGYLTLRGLVERAIDPAAAVLVAPMLGLRAPGGAAAGEALARIVGHIGRVERAAWKGNERPATLASRQALLTHDADRYEDELWWQRRDLRLLTGPPSWRWLIGAFAGTRRLAAGTLDHVTTPVQMLVAEADRLVDPAAAIRIAARLPDCRLVRFGGESAHEILREVDSVRDRALAEIDGFLARRAGKRA